MKKLITCAAVALVATGCAIPELSTELDPGGAPRYTAAGSTGTNITHRVDPQAAIKAGQRTVDPVDLQRMLQGGGPCAPGGCGAGR